jgi:allophanate hydrolase subunit 2
VRVLLGPQEDRFGSAGIAAFLSQPWRVSASSDRRGVRLEGDPIRHEGSAEIAPEGTAPGAIQVPADGRPIVLGPDGPVTGGYAKIATVVAADWPLVAQAGPGGLLRFRADSPA